MNDSDLIKFIKQVVKEQLAAVLMAQVVANKDSNRSTVQRFASDSPIPNLRNIQPYGISSRAPKGTSCLTVPIASDPSHINMVGHFDEDRPTTADGETLLYNEFGQLIYLSEGKIQIGSKAAAENLVLGQVFKAYEASLLDAIIAHKHLDSFGYLTQPPDNAADFTALKASPIEDEAILSDECFTEKG